MLRLPRYKCHGYPVISVTLPRYNCYVTPV
nr:MAG TPA: hypothetical protein [Caudoviricetes sp.]